MDSAPFHNLSPDKIIDAIEQLGYVSDLRVLPLNSYENRVYQFGLEDKDPIIAKFYRPNRWTDEQIQEEHAFSLSLAELEVPVVPPLRNDSGEPVRGHATDGAGHIEQDHRRAQGQLRAAAAPPFVLGVERVAISARTFALLPVVLRVALHGSVIGQTPVSA